MPEMTAHKEGDPSFLHACAVEPSYKLHHDLRTKPAKNTIILDPNIPVADPGEGVFSPLRIGFPLIFRPN